MNETPLEAISQRAAIIAYLQQGYTLTPIEALNLFGCFRLSARIYDLRNMGHAIERTTQVTPSGKRVAKYKLAH